MVRSYLYSLTNQQQTRKYYISITVLIDDFTVEMVNRLMKCIWINKYLHLNLN